MNKLKTELSLPAYTGMTDVEAAELVNSKTIAGLKEVYVNARTILSEIGAIDGAVFLDALEVVAASNNVVKWILSFLQLPDGVNVGDIETRIALDNLVVAGVLNADAVATIKALAEIQVPEIGFTVTAGQVQAERN